ncbi:hypothetical protein DPMN_190941 [Dreissena polymorpha]|uniref:Uncharacterized protein n=1 Tax=Dreissena polymorpha TaxID=45954 RepID=A0A9D3Y1X6_DREPO|nr:hypothetical protein DPMN_190941 [Dreissena polymorpha]
MHMYFKKIPTSDSIGLMIMLIMIEKLLIVSLLLLVLLLIIIIIIKQMLHTLKINLPINESVALDQAYLKRKQNTRFGLLYAQNILELGRYYQTNDIETQAPSFFSTLSRPDIDLQLTTIVKKSDNDPDSGSIAQTHITNNYPNYIQIYTDGSKNDELQVVGAAYVVYNTQNAVIITKK